MTTELDDLCRQAKEGWGTAPYKALKLKEWADLESKELENYSINNSSSNVLTAEDLEIWNTLLYKEQVLISLIKQTRSEEVIGSLKEVLERLLKTKSKYLNLYKMMPEIAKHNKITFFYIIDMLSRLCKVLEGMPENNDLNNLNNDFALVIERIRNFWRLEPSLLGDKLVPGPQKNGESVKEYYNQSIKPLLNFRQHQ